jgi:uncharacterized membrane protein
MNTATPSESFPPAATEDKTAAIVCYLTLIGFIAAVIIHGSKKTRLGAYHLRQALGLMLFFVAAGFCAIVPILGWIVWIVAMIFGFVLWVMALIAAINGEMKPVPVLGEHFQKWFGNAFD